MRAPLSHAFVLCTRTVAPREFYDAAEGVPQVYTVNPTRYKAVRAWVHEDDANPDNYPYFYTLS